MMHSLLNDPKAVWHHLFENSVVGIALVDSKGKFVKVNPRLQEILGYTDYELSRIGFQDITLPADIEADEEALSELKAGRTTSYSMRKRYFTKDGKVVWARLTVYPHIPERLEPGSTAQDLCFVSHIEEISSAESKLEKLVEKQSEIIEHYTTETTAILARILTFIDTTERATEKEIKWSMWKLIDTHAQWVVPTLIMVATFFVTSWRAQIIQDYEIEKIIREVRAEDANQLPRVDRNEQSPN